MSGERKMLWLASASPRRRELLSLLGLPFQVEAADVDETVEANLSPAEIVETLAKRKAEALRRRRGPAAGQRGVIIGSDTIVVHKGRVLGKPADRAEAEAMIASLQGGAHEVYSGIALIDEDSGAERTGHRMTRVRMKPLTPLQIKGYAASGEGADKAGAYGIQGLGSVLVSAIEGDYFNVVGLPVSLLADMLETFGVRVL